LPFASGHGSTVDLTLSSGDRLRIGADRRTVLFTGEPEFVEDFEGQDA
jgi:hypothetical protein